MKQNAKEIKVPLEQITVRARDKKDDLETVGWDDLSFPEQEFLTLVLADEFDEAARVLAAAQLEKANLSRVYNFLEVFLSQNEGYFPWHQVFEHPAIIQALDLKSHASTV